VSTELLFDITFYLAAPFWLLMVFAPNWRGTQRAMASPWVAAIPLAVYFFFAFPHFADLWTMVSVPNLSFLRDFLNEPYGAALVWAQIISFDLFIGRWMYLEARELGIRPLVMAPILLLTILLSPFGLVLFLVVRTATSRRNLDAVAPAMA
jgi:hypothetical protein